MPGYGARGGKRLGTKHIKEGKSLLIFHHQVSLPCCTAIHQAYIPPLAPLVGVMA
jgi:hypothetical protein